MRRRMGGEATGLGGNSSPELMSGTTSGNAEFDKLLCDCALDAYKTFFQKTSLDFNYCDAGIDSDEIRFGIEPSYQYDDLKVISFHKNKNLSRFITGRAWGAWGSDIAKKEKWYDGYQRQSKFVRFVDKWHPILFEKSC